MHNNTPTCTRKLIHENCQSLNALRVLVDSTLESHNRSRTQKGQTAFNINETQYQLIEITTGTPL